MRLPIELSHALLCAVCSVAFVAGCGGDDTDPVSETDADGGSSVDGSSVDGNGGPTLTLNGAFNISLLAKSGTSPARTAVVGAVKDGPNPVLAPMVEKATDGDCRLLVPKAPFCDPACAGGQACVGDNTCQAYPKAVDVGAVTIEGLKTSDGKTSVPLQSLGGFYQAVGVTLAHPGVDEGATVTLKAAGAGDIPAFTAQARGIAELLMASDAIKLDGKSDATLKWKAPAKPGSRITVEIDISHHGGTKGLVTCDTDDTGSVKIGGALLAALKDLGVSGFPRTRVTRTSIGKAPANLGDVRIAVVSMREQEVVIPGVVSCNNDKDCPTGQACQQDLKCE